MRRASDKWERIGHYLGGVIGLPGCCWTCPLVAVIGAWVVGRTGG